MPYNQGYRPDYNSYNYGKTRGYGAGMNRQNNGYSTHKRAGKHSGCQIRTISKGKRQGQKIIFGWKYTRGIGLVKYTAFYYKDAHSEKYQWECWIVETVNITTGDTGKFTALFNPKKETLFNAQMNIILNPRAKNGGYIGKRFSQEYSPRR